MLLVVTFGDPAHSHEHARGARQRGTDVTLKGCNPNRASRSARSSPSSSSACLAYAASSACGGARSYQGRVGEAQRARVVSSPPPPRPSSLCQVLPARCPRPWPPPAKV
eukprot:scaffold103495_cov60-Phaeocystis_antarctica.AAC.1